ncbi:MAG: C-terminal binding protein [Gaiellaceae bacterium]
MSHRVVIAGASFPDCSAAIEELSSINAAAVDATRMSTRETLELLPSADALMTDYFPVDAAAIDRLERCQIICRLGVGLDKVDIEAATRAAIQVAYVPDYCRGELADHGLALLLAVSRRIVAYDASVRAGSWDYNVPGVVRLEGRTLGLVGFGAIARRLAERVRPLGMNVLAADPYVSDEDVRAAGSEPAGLERVLAEADVVSLHAPLTPETTHLVGPDELDQMKKTAILINTARGGLVDQDALVAALASGSIAGAGLDVLRPEPPSRDDPLLELDNVVLTPHAGHYSEESVLQVQQDGAREVVRALTGKPLKHAVNRIATNA